MYINKFLAISISFVFFNIEASDSKKKGSDSLRIAQSISTQVKNCNNLTHEKKSQLAEQNKNQLEEDLQVVLENLRKDVKEYQNAAQDTRKNICELEEQQKPTSKKREESKESLSVDESSSNVDLVDDCMSINSVDLKVEPQVNPKIDSENSSVNKKESKLIKKTKRQREEEMFAAYQIAAQESRKDIEKHKQKSKTTLKDIAELDNLFVAIENAGENISLVQRYISRLPLDKINIVNKKETALLCAIKKNRLDIVKLLLAKGANPNIQGYKGVTALMLAISKGYLDIVKELLAHKATDPNVKTENGTTVLMSAVINNKAVIVKMLLDKGAKVDIQGPEKVTALMLAMKNKPDEENFLSTVKMGFQDMFSVFLDNLDFKDLVYAAYENNPDMAKMLLNKGDDSNIQNNRDIVKMLLEAGANSNIQMNNGATALMLAVLQNKWDVVKILLEAGANINIQTNDGNSVLNYAIQDGNLEIIELLLSKNPSIDLRSNDGFTPLMIAYYYYAVSSTENYKKIIELLEDYGFVITQEEKSKVNFYLDQTRSNLQGIAKKESLNNGQQENINEATKDLDKSNTGLLGSEEFIEISKEESAERKRLFDLFDLEKRQIRQAENIKNAETKKFKNLIKQLEEEKKELEALAKSDRSERELSKPKTFEDVIQQKGGLTDLQKNIAKFHFDKLLSSKQINNLISQEEDLNYSFGKDLFGLGSVSFDWSHIINLSIGWEYDFKTNLYVPSFEGGHSKETIDRLIQSGLVKKISEKKWKNGCAEYVLENIWTGKRFSKTVFPANFDISNIYTAITQGKIKKKEETSKESFLNPKIEMVIEYNNILIKAVLAKQFFGYEIITAFPIEKIENPIAKSSMSAISYAPSPAARFF